MAFLLPNTDNYNHQSHQQTKLPQASFFHNNMHLDPNGLSHPTHSLPVSDFWI
jgi:hypothetical protein